MSPGQGPERGHGPEDGPSAPSRTASAPRTLLPPPAAILPRRARNASATQDSGWAREVCAGIDTSFTWPALRLVLRNGRIRVRAANEQDEVQGFGFAGRPAGRDARLSDRPEGVGV